MKLYRLISLLFICSVTLIATPIVTHAAGWPVSYFRSAHSGLCLDVNGGSTSNGARVQQWDCNNTNAQKWEIVYAGGGPRFNGQAGNYYFIKNVGSGKCLDVIGASRSNGAGVTQWDCHGGTNQRWLLYNHISWNFKVTLVNQNSGKCLDVLGWSRNRGASIGQWDCNIGNRNQQWDWNGNSR